MRLPFVRALTCVLVPVCDLQAWVNQHEATEAIILPFGSSMWLGLHAKDDEYYM
jgi:hypothetical protein